MTKAFTFKIAPEHFKAQGIKSVLVRTGDDEYHSFAI